ncbi:D-glutamate cyclase family protein [Pseudomonas syringae]
MLFWACGVTPQAALKAADIPVYIGHTPAHVLVTDVTTDQLRDGNYKVS